MIKIDIIRVDIIRIDIIRIDIIISIIINITLTMNVLMMFSYQN